jgi:hypothetical protein
MAWYTKQLKALEKSKEAKKKKTSMPAKKSGTSFQAEKIKNTKNSFPSPVSARNRNRSKTDSL